MFELFEGSMRKSIRVALSGLGAVVLVAACGGDTRDISNQSFDLAPLTFTTIDLDAGTYTAQVSSSPNGVIVGWTGGSGAGCAETALPKRSHVTTCTLTMKGQLMIANVTDVPDPASAPAGAGVERVTIKLEKDG